MTRRGRVGADLGRDLGADLQQLLVMGPPPDKIVKGLVMLQQGVDVVGVCGHPHLPALLFQLSQVSFAEVLDSQGCRVLLEDCAEPIHQLGFFD